MAKRSETIMAGKISEPAQATRGPSVVVPANAGVGAVDAVAIVPGAVTPVDIAALTAVPTPPAIGGRRHRGGRHDAHAVERDAGDVTPANVAQSSPAPQPGKPADSVPAGASTPASAPAGAAATGGHGGGTALLALGGLAGAGLIAAAVGSGGGGGSASSSGGGSATPAPVNRAPVATADSYTTAEDTALTIAAAGVLANDTDADGNALTAVLVSGPAHGTLTLNANGGFVYTPATNYNGADSFSYKPNDGIADGNAVTVSLTVTPVNDAPVAVADSYTTAEDTALTVAAAGVLTNDTDVEGSALSAVLVTGPAHGTLALNANGGFVYTPATNYNGADSFTYKPNDGSVDGNIVTVSLAVTPINDAPVAVADSYTTAEDTALTVAAAGVLANDTDVEGSALSAVLVSGPAHGTLALNANGGFVYTPAANYNGADSFSYRPNDGTTDGNTVTVSLTVTPVNDAPVAVADSYTTAEDTALAVVARGVLVNDTDVEGSALSAVLVSGPAHGTLALNANGGFVYTPTANYNGADSFSYKPNDGTTDGNTVTVSLAITPVNDAPVAVADTYTTAEDTALIVAAAGVLANDTDVEGSALSAVLVSGPTHGTLALNANGGFVYTPAADYNGADSFTYKPNDGTTDGNAVTVSLTVTPVNDVPVAVADSYTTAEDTTLTVAAAGVLVNDTDVEGSALSAVLVSGPAHGTLALNANGGFVYTPTANYNGADSFSYKPNDGTADGNTVTVSLAITPVNDAPVAVADSYTTAEDTTLAVAAKGVLANDTDVEGNGLSAVLVTGPAHGTLVLNANGSFTYTPAANYNGADSFTYKPNDGAADGNTVTVDLNVTPVNDAPSAVADSFTTAEDTALTVAAAGVLTNDTDVEGSALSAVLVAGPAHGTLALNANGGFVYTPAANYNGADSFTYKPNDGTADGNTVTVSLTVTPVNDAPIAVADSYTTAEDTALAVAAAGVLANDTDVDGNALSAVLVTGPAHGTLSLSGNGAFTYIPAADYNGADSFTYKPNDGTTDGNAVTVSLAVTPVNDSPVAVADSYTTAEDTTLTIAAAGVLANDTDVDGNALSAVLVSGPAHGTLALNANGSFTYTPTANYNGSDTFSYRANDGITNGNIATVTLTVTPVNDAPVAIADAYGVVSGATLTVPAAGVLTNDTDVEGDALTALLVTGAAHGAVALNANGSFTYTPTAGYSGPDSFTYKANDGTADGNAVAVSLTVAAGNAAPVATGDSYTTAEDTALTVAAAGVLANDTDADGNALTAMLVSGPAHGTLTLNTNGGFVYTPAANYNGTDSFTYRPNDGFTNGNTVTVNLNVTPVNDAPVASADSYTTAEDTVLTIAATGVLANDTDVEGSVLNAVLVAGPAHGTLTLNASGGFVYTPVADYNGVDSFTYKPNDGIADGNTVTVSLTVTPVNDVPVAVADSYTTAEDTTLTVAAAGVLANDTDVEGNALSAVLVNGPAHGTLTLSANGAFVYTPTADYNGGDSFTYKPNDGNADGNTVTVSLTVTPVNDAPVAVVDTFTTAEDTALNVTAAGVLTNDTDVDGDPLTAALVSGPAHGTLALNANGGFVYTPVANYNGVDTFSYRANDGTANGNVATVNLNVTPVNDAPVAVADSYTTAQDTALSVAAAGVLTNDTDVDGDPLTAALISGPAHGTLALNSTGAFTYTPTAGYRGADSFTYRANDGSANSNAATVSLNVAAVNHAPVAVNDTATASEDAPLTVAAAGVLANDTDSDGNTLNVSSVAGGTVGTQFALASGALLTLNANGSYIYNPNGKFEALRPGQTATDSFSYTASDGALNSNAATATITIQGANERPAAVADTYNGVFGNTPITYAAAQGVLANDSDPDGSAAALTVTQVNGTAIGGSIAVTGGTVTMSANGAFTFQPTTGFQGASSFTYTVADADGGTSTATATLNVNSQIWYVDSSASAAGADGSYGHAFTSLAPLNTAGDPDGANDTIFVYNRGTAYTSGIALEAGQKLYGDAHEFTVNGIAIGAAGVTANSTIGATAGVVVTLATDNTLDGLTLNANGAGVVGLADGNGSVTTTGGVLAVTHVTLAGTGQAIAIDQGGNVNISIDSLTSTGSLGNGVQLAGTAASGTGLITGTVTIASGSISGATGSAFLVGAGGGATDNSGGNVNVSYAGTLTGNAGRTVEVEDRTGGTLTFSGNIDHSAAATSGIVVDGNGDGTVNFTGQSIQISSGTATGIQLSNNSPPTRAMPTDPILSAVSFAPAAGGNGLDITTTSGTGLLVTGGTGITVTGTGNTVTTTTGGIVNFSQAMIGSAGVTFATLSDTGVFAGSANSGAVNLSNVSGGTFDGGTLTVAGTAGSTSAHGVRISGGNAAVNFAGATIDNTSGDGLSIATSGAVTIGTVDIDNTTGAGIRLSGQNNAVAINGGSVGATNDPTGNALNITGGSGSATIAASLAKTTAGNVVQINNHATGTINLTGTVSATGAVNNGILLLDNFSGAINFTNAVTLTTGTFAALNDTNSGVTGTVAKPVYYSTGADVAFTSGAVHISTTTAQGIIATANTIGAGSLTVTGGGNTVVATALDPGLIGVNVSGVGIGAAGLNFASINTNGGQSGIVLANTGTAGGLTISGDAGTTNNFSGGTIRTATGDGISLTNTRGVSLDQVRVINNAGSGIHGTNVTNFALTDSTITTNGDSNAAGAEEANVRFDGLLGTATIASNAVSGGYTSNLLVVNTTGTLDRATVQNNVFGTVNTAGGNDNVSFQVGATATDTGTLKVSLIGNSFSGTRGDFIQTVATGNTTLETVARNNIFQNGQAIAAGGGTGVFIQSGSAGTSAATTTFDIAGNQVNGAQGNAFDKAGIAVVKLADNGTLSGTIQGNTVGPAKVGAAADGILVRSAGGGSTTVLIQNNTVTGYGDAGISLQNDTGTGTLNATLYGNTASAPQSGTGLAFAGLAVVNTATGTDTNKLNLLVGSATNAAQQNDFSAGDPANATDVNLKNVGTSSFTLSTNGSAAITAAQVIKDDNQNAATTTIGTTGTITLVTTTPALPNPLPLLAAVAPDAMTTDHAVVTQHQLDVIVTAAIQRWADAGATAEQVAAMRAVDVSFADLAGAQIGGARAGAIQFDIDAAGHGWFVDATPNDDTEFAKDGARLTATAGSGAAGHLDLLTTVMHELGHQIGLLDANTTGDHADVMDAALDLGERRLPGAADLSHRDASAGVLSDGVDLSGLASVVAAHAGAPAVAAQGWREAVAPAMAVGADHSLDGLLAHLGQGDIGHGGPSGGDQAFAVHFGAISPGTGDFAAQIDIRPDMFAHLDHSVL